MIDNIQDSFDAPEVVDTSDSWDDAPEDKTEEKEVSQQEEPKETPKERQRRLERIQVNGKEEVVDVDELLKNVSKFKAADQRLREAAQQQKAIESFIQQLQSNPEKILNNPNIPLSKEARQKLAEQWLVSSLEEELQDPRDKELSEKDRQLKAYQEREEQERQQYEAQLKAQAIEARRTELSKTFEAAMAQSPLSQDPAHTAEVLRDMAMYVRVARQNGENPSPEEVARHVENSTLARFHRVAQSLSGEMLVKLLGPQVLKAMREHDLSELRKRRGHDNFTQSESWEKSEPKTTTTKHMSPMDARDEVRKRLGIK